MHKHLLSDVRALHGAASNHNIEIFQKEKYCYFVVMDSLKNVLVILKPKAYRVIENV